MLYIVLALFCDSMPARIRLLRRLRIRGTYTTEEYHYESCGPDLREYHCRHRTANSTPAPRRRYTYPPSSGTNASENRGLHWVRSSRARARPFTTHSARPDFITVEMDRPRPRSFWRSLFGLEYFDIFQRMKETRTRHEQERPIPRLSRDRYSYTRPHEPRYRDEPRGEGPRMNPPRRAASPPRSRPLHRRAGSQSLPRRGVRSISPGPRFRYRSYEFVQRDVRRQQEPAYTRPRPRPARPSSPINEREPPRRGRYTSPVPVSVSAPPSKPGPNAHSRVNIIQRNPRAVTSQTGRSYTTAQPTSSRPYYADIINHDSVRERINRNRNRIHSPELASPTRSRKVRFHEGHEEIGGPVYYDSNCGSSSASDSDCDSDYRPGPSRVSTQPRPRPRRVVIVHPRGGSPAGSVERHPGVERRRVSPIGDVRREPCQGRGRERERAVSGGVMYEVREPRGVQGRVRDSRRYV